jgi:C_GCAxxG_C_C family probable redox protein
MSHAAAAKAMFDQHYACSQAVLSAYAQEFGLERNLALKVAAGFGGGMGRLAGTCGAVTGAFMALGLKYGMTDAANQAAKETTYAAVQAFARKFRERFGTLDCRDLLGTDLSAPEGLAIAREQQLFSRRCPVLIQAATEILDELL